MNWLGIIAIGAGVGFLSGMFGKGGSAVATPLLHAMGIPAIVALAAPLPATVPSTLAASIAYWRQRLVNEPVVRTSIVCGVGATVLGAVASRWVGGGPLVIATDLVVIGLGLRSLLTRTAEEPSGVVGDAPPRAGRPVAVVAAVAVAVGFAAGLLANSGGFLLAPLYMAVLRLPVKHAFASSLLVSAALAVPGTIVHAALGHIDWALVAVFGTASVPLSYLGARVAIRTPSEPLERVYGAGLTILGVTALVWLR